MILAGAVLCLNNGCTVYPNGDVAVNGQVDVSDDPPAVITETIPDSPGPDYVWIGGAWVWNGNWVWEHGRWAHPPHPGAVWVAHRVVVRNGHRVFVRGGWR